MKKFDERHFQINFEEFAPISDRETEKFVKLDRSGVEWGFNTKLLFTENTDTHSHVCMCIHPYSFYTSNLMCVCVFVRLYVV